MSAEAVVVGQSAVEVRTVLVSPLAVGIAAEILWAHLRGGAVKWTREQKISRVEFLLRRGGLEPAEKVAYERVLAQLKEAV